MNIGVIGIGYWGSKVLREYLNLVEEEKVDAVGICDVNQNVLKRYNDCVIKISKDYKKFLSSDDIDAIHICTNNDSHYEIARTAIEAGKHVLLEKPMTTNANQAYKLVEMASNRGIILQVGHIFRFANAIRKTKELVKKDYFGEIYYFTLRWTTLMTPIEGVDVIWDLLPHPIDILNFLTGEFPIKIDGVARSYRREKLNEMAIINMEYEKRFIANIELSWLSPKRRRSLEIIGSNRTGEIECVKQRIHIHEGIGNKFEIPVEKNNTIKEELENFLKAIKSGKAMYNAHIVGARAVDIIEKTINNIK